MRLDAVRSLQSIHTGAGASSNPLTQAVPENRRTIVCEASAHRLELVQCQRHRDNREYPTCTGCQTGAKLADSLLKEAQEAKPKTYGNQGLPMYNGLRKKGVR